VTALPLLSVLHLLSPEDQLSIVSFASTARECLQLTFMNHAGQQEAEKAVNQLKVEGSTELWAGLSCGMDALREVKSSEALRVLLLLTDGEPSDANHVEKFQRYAETHPDFHFQLHTFGFGKASMGTLLRDLAVAGGGSFVFVPDAKIVGTSFVNAIANAASTLTQRAELHLELQDGATFAAGVLGGAKFSDTQWARVVMLGHLAFGQVRDLVVPLRVRAESQLPYLKVTLVYTTSNNRQVKLELLCDNRIPRDGALATLERVMFVDGAMAALQHVAALDVHTALVDLAAAVRRLQAKGLATLLGDLEGRVQKAFSTEERQQRWGRAYVLAFVRSHQLQICTTFMDPSLQPYGGSLFRHLVRTGEALFTTLPAPKPSCAPSLSALPTPAPRPAARNPAPSMTQYYAGSGGGCFAASASVLRRVDGLTPMDQLQVGDLVCVSGGDFVAVQFVAQIRVPSTLVRIDKLLITPSHPIRVNGQWTKPKYLSPIDSQRADLVYNVVLESNHILVVDGVECLTWGHKNLHPAVAHDFYAEKVVACLQRLPEDGGKVVVQRVCKQGGKTVAFQ
jgi:hypothetical protein